MAPFGSNPSMADLPEVLVEARRAMDDHLTELAERLEAETPGRLGEALGYALRSPGKRVRPALLLATYRAAGGRDPAVVGLATAVEVVHTYSLVHDDLPCMDDDGLRRGRPTTHVAFDVETATRIGFLLVPVAAEELAAAGRAMGLSTAVTGAMALELFTAGGIQGMVGGQWLDLEAEGRRVDLAGLMDVHRRKTGALIAAAALLGARAAGAADDVLAAVRVFGEEIGLAFQVADDVLDATRTSHELGKTAGKDAEDQKSTYVGLLGVTAAEVEADRHCTLALGALEGAGLPVGDLAVLARYIVRRTS
jgi:geranylgeranyl pyrophosphate synthase